MKRVLSKTNVEYNNSKDVVGSPLKTYSGSTIKRSKYGVGKEIGGDIYVHKDYAEDVMGKDVYRNALFTLDRFYPGFQFNCVRWSPKTGDISFQEAPDFDSAREPIVGKYVTVKEDGTTRFGKSNYIWHHKWLWVTNDYTGFDVAESWNWSRKWLNSLTETSDGNGIQRWNAQLQKYNLPLDS